MPTDPNNPSPGASGISRQEFLPGKGAHYVHTGAVQQAVVPSNAVAIPDSIADAFSGTVALTFPAQASGTNATASGTLTVNTWPQNLVLNNRTAYVSVTTSLASIPMGVLLGHPYVVLTFAGGSPLSGPSMGTSTYFLSSGGTYKNPSISVTAQGFYLATAASPITVLFSVTAILHIFSTATP